MIKILALDISSHAGFAVMEVLEHERKLTHKGIVEKRQKINEYGEYPWSYRQLGAELAADLYTLVSEHRPTVIVIEETNLGRSRYAQKALEFIHCSFLNLLAAEQRDVVYLSSSEWRRALGLAMTKEQKKANALLAKAKKEAKASKAKLDKKTLGVRGKVTKKHLAIAYANQAFGLQLKVKDNDIADAVCLALAYLAGAEHCDGRL